MLSKNRNCHRKLPQQVRTCQHKITTFQEWLDYDNKQRRRLRGAYRPHFVELYVIRYNYVKPDGFWSQQEVQVVDWLCRKDAHTDVEMWAKNNLPKPHEIISVTYQ